MTHSKSLHPSKLTHAPWAGYTSHEHKREVPLPCCPSARCKRVKCCVAAHEGLYCQRTHISHAEFRREHPRKPPPHFSDDLEMRREWLIDQIEQRRAAHKQMVERWQAGEFDHLYGKYSARGVVLKPPPQIYVVGD
jgi:hypothetical protein